MSDATFEQWRALVEKGLEGAPFESLTATTLEGIPIAPLYSEQDRPAAEGIPWAPHAQRAVGRVIDDAREVHSLAKELASGASAAWLYDHGLRLADEGAFEVPAGLVVLIEPLTHAHVVVDAASSGVRVVADPSGEDAAEHLDAIARAIGRGVAAVGVGVGIGIGVGGGHYPADAVADVAWIASSLVRQLRELETRGIDPERAAAAATIVVRLDSDFFSTIAKVRAVRRVADRVLSAAGLQARPWIAARTSTHVLAAVDEANNALRNTLATAGALIGGADVIATQPHDAIGTRAARGARLARNTPLVLALESHLAAAEDPARGSAFLEALTRDICTRAWATFTTGEARRGAVEQAAGEAAGRREHAIATRRRPLVGVSRFPVPGEPLLRASDVRYEQGPRDSEWFEVLRERAVPASRVVVLGACPEPRVDFAREVAQLASQQVEVVREVDRGDAGFVILAAPDAELDTSVVEAARTLSGAGAKVAVAGRPGAHEQALRDAGVSSFVFVGANVVEALEALLPRKGRA